MEQPPRSTSHVIDDLMQSETQSIPIGVTVATETAARRRRDRKCIPCKSGKRGPCTEDPENPGGCCFECKVKRREDKCRDSDSGHDRKRQRIEESIPEIIQLQADVSTLKAEVAELKRRNLSLHEIHSVNVNVDKANNSTTATTVDTTPYPELWEHLLNEYTNIPSETSDSLSFAPLFPPAASHVHPTYDHLSHGLEPFTSPHCAGAIADFLDHYHFPTKECDITILRIGIIPTKGLANVNDAGSSQFFIIEWREGEETDVVAIFKAEPPDDLCNVLLHHTPNPPQKSGDDQRPSYSWYVSNIIHLRDLFMVAQHTLPLFSSDESPNLMLRFFQEDSTTCSPEELNKHIKLLLPHLVVMKQLSSRFEIIAPALRGLSKEQDICRKDGSKYTLLQGQIPL